jgi:pimeloyl-ACP methyl ester carboxylesterase
MSIPRFPAPPRPESSAEVHAHDRVIRYRHSGSGPAVLLLASEGSSLPLWPELLEELGRRFRLIAPVLPAADSAAAELADFLEGLGMDGVTVIAAGSFCIPALELALRDADQIARVVLVPDGQSTDSAWGGTLATRAREAAIPLLVMRRGVAAAEALSLFATFLAGRAPGAPGS